MPLRETTCFKSPWLIESQEETPKQGSFHSLPVFTPSERSTELDLNLSQTFPGELVEEALEG